MWTSTVWKSELESFAQNIVSFAFLDVPHGISRYDIGQTGRAPLCRSRPGGQTGHSMTAKTALDRCLLWSWIKSWISSQWFTVNTFGSGWVTLHYITNLFCSYAVTFSFPPGPLLTLHYFIFYVLGYSVSHTAQRKEAKFKFFKPKGSFICFTVRTKCSECRKGYI